jgi:hypothetical protein
MRVEPRESDPALAAAGPMLSAARRRMVRAFPWHLRGFVAGNLLLSVVNALTGGPWWAFWPLVASGFALAVHYLVYKTAAVDAEWVAARTEELNLKSYDRSHIEELKARYGADAAPDEKKPVP